jgi:hypothetical protein
MSMAQPDTGCPVSYSESKVADDKLEGTAAIAAELGVSPRRAHYLLERSLIPAGKIGGRWIASKRRLREHFAAVAAGTAA